MGQFLHIRHSYESVGKLGRIAGLLPIHRQPEGPLFLASLVIIFHQRGCELHGRIGQDVGAKEAEIDNHGPYIERLYLGMQFAEKFENKGGLGSKHTIRERLAVLSTKGFVKFRRDATVFGYPLTRSPFGYLCVEGMIFGSPEETVDPETGEITETDRPVLPSHYKCPQSGSCLDVENPAVWVYPEDAEDVLKHMCEA